MVKWKDYFTGAVYTLDTNWIQEVRRHLAELLTRSLKKDDDIKKQADNAATFWSNDYYSLVFLCASVKKLKAVLSRCGAFPHGESGSSSRSFAF